MLKLSLPVPDAKLLLHSCCAPCSGAILECMLENGIRPLVFFSNSNIVPFEEYELRKKELERYALSKGLEVVDDDYDHEAWLCDVVGADEALVRCPERGLRCTNCFRFRLLRAARYASANGFGLLATTLASSRWKDLNQVNEAGEWACAQVEGCRFWAGNWRKGGLQPRRNEIIREESFYNQIFCGCEFSH